MTDLKALRRKIAKSLVLEFSEPRDIEPDVELADLIESALLQYAEACLGEPSDRANTLGYIEMTEPKGFDSDAQVINAIWTAMASQRLKEIKE